MASPQSVFTNPELLNISDLSSQLERMNNRPNNGLLAMQGLNSLVDQFNNKNKEDQIKNAMQGAFNQETGQFDQSKILQGLVNIDPNLAMQYQERFNKSNLESLVKQSQAENFGAQATKNLSESKKKKLEAEKIMVESLSERLSSLRSDDVDGWNNILRQAEKSGISASQYGLQYNKPDIEKAQKLAMGAKDYYNSLINGKNLLLNQRKAQTQESQFAQTHGLAQDRFAFEQQKQEENIALKQQEASQKSGGNVFQVVETAQGLKKFNRTTGELSNITNSDGKVQGGKENKKVIDGINKSISAVNSMSSRRKEFAATLDQLANSDLEKNTGIVKSYIQKLGVDKELANLEAIQNRYAAQAGFGNLSQMKQESTTGSAGLGALSNYELQMLIAMSGMLTTKMGAENIRNEIERLRGILSRQEAEERNVLNLLKQELDENKNISNAGIGKAERSLNAKQPQQPQGQDMEAIKRAYMMSKGVNLQK